MPIIFDEQRKIFKLDTLESTYAIGIREGFLIHLYYGKRISDDNLWTMPFRGYFASISPNNVSVDDYKFSLDVQPMEYSCNGSGDFRLAALSIKDSMGRTTTDIRYLDHKIYNGKPKLKGLPATYCNDDSEAQTLELITLRP